MDYGVDDEVTIHGRWYLIENIEEDGVEVFYLLSDSDGNNRWATEEDFD
jgi:hypothetical protein